MIQNDIMIYDRLPSFVLFYILIYSFHINEEASVFIYAEMIRISSNNIRKIENSLRQYTHTHTQKKKIKYR